MSNYEGPTGIVGVLADAAVQVGIPSVSAWAAIPHYAGHTPSPRATAALLTAIETLLDAPIDHGDLDGDGRAWQRGVDELAQGDPDIAEYVETSRSPGHRRTSRGQRRRDRQGVRAHLRRRGEEPTP